MRIIKKFSRLWLLLLCLLITAGCSSRAKGTPVQTSGQTPETKSVQQQSLSETKSGNGQSASVSGTKESVSVPKEQTSAQTQPSKQVSGTKQTSAQTQHQAQASSESRISENGSYTSKDEVALYIKQYDRLPGNFITKKEAQELGWSGGSLEKYAPGKCIGGDRFGNYEGKLPKKNGRTYTECDIDTLGKSSRGAKRIVFSNDGLIYYTDDHYDTFTLLYGNP